MPPDSLRALGVIMTMVGGEVVYCSIGMEAFCPQPASAPTAASAATFRDDFDGALDPAWAWFQNDAPGWSLTDSPGWLRLQFSTGSFFNPPPPSNLLLRPSLAGDFDARTHVRASPTQNFQLAGMVVLFDDTSVLQFGRGFCDGFPPCAGDGYYFDNIQSGAPVGTNFAAPGTGSSDDLLRLVRQGSTYTAHVFDGTNWVEIGSHSVDREPISIGLIAAQSPSSNAFAEYDYYEITAP
jgi:hypothetical protein